MIPTQPVPACDRREDEPIPQEELDRACRKMCRRIAAALVRAMAETDTDFATIAARTTRSEESLRSFIRALIDGKAPRNGLEMMAIFAVAMECEIEFHIVRREAPDTPPIAPAPTEE